ncbi:MAG: S8 family serine peptidase [Phycisphaerae bacterium]|nr:S8 family serine peptidase [Phycisphaerae bacterium]
MRYICTSIVVSFMLGQLAGVPSGAAEVLVDSPVQSPVPGTQVIDPATGLRSYLVMLEADPTEIGPEAASAMATEAITKSIGADRMRFIYDYAITGFAAWMTEDEAARMRNFPGVLVVEPDLYQSIANASAGLDTNPNEPDPWNLRRISSPDGLAPAYDPCGADGSGVTAIIIDTGICLDQTLFAGRIQDAVSFVAPTAADLDGHGTHVAGTIAGIGVGVAPGCEIVALQVESGDGMPESAIIAALNWVANPANAAPPSVVNMSLGGPVRGTSGLVRFFAISTVAERGIPVVVAAGNDGRTAYWTAPANVIFALTVGATNVFDQPAAFSNYGAAVDIWAPGVGILSANSEHPDGGLKFESGTSQAAPCVSGVVALFLERHVTAEQIEHEPEYISSRAHIALARAAVPALVDITDPLIGVPGGTGTIAGSANQLLQACDGPLGVACDEDVDWHGNTASIILGDGITPIPGSFECTRTISNAAGLVELTINTLSSNLDATLPSIQDVASGETLWPKSLPVDNWETYRFFQDRTVVSSSRQGLRVIWPGQDDIDVMGYGYVMTAHVRDNCAGDINGTGSVNVSDLLTVLDTWGPCDPTIPCIADLDGNGEVGINDVLAVIGQWGACAEYLPPGFIHDCNGNLVPKGFLGDKFLDTGERHILVNPIFEPLNITAVDLNCAELNWDTLEGNSYTISPNDPRVGACTITGDSCIQTDFYECGVAGGMFWGRGISCDAITENGDQYLHSPICDSESSISYGSPLKQIPIPNTGGYTTYRQPVDPGIYSISRIGWVSAVAHSASRTAPNIDGHNKFSLGLPLLSDAVFGVTVYYVDGGPSTFIRCTPEKSPIAATNSTSGAFVTEDLLPAGDREIASIRLARDPDGLQCQSSKFFQPSLVGVEVASDSGQLFVEQSKDGGRTWYPFISANGQSVQMNLCITP